jgi:AcrR family transcriptional regulator
VDKDAPRGGGTVVEFSAMAPPKKRLANDTGDRAGDRRQEILDAAATLFAAEGVVSTTVRDIARVAGILSGSLYHHFDSKESMVDEILAPSVGKLVEADEAVVAAKLPTLEALDQLIRAVVNAVTTEPIAWRILQNDFSYLNSLPRFAYLQQFDDRVTGIWTTLLRKGAREGVIRSDIPPDLLYRFIRDSIAMLARWYRPEGRYSQKVIADSWVALVFEGVVHKTGRAAKGG